VQATRPVDQLPTPIVVTGAAHGIGAATATLAARAGAAVALLDRDAEAAKALASRLRDAGAPGPLLALGCDVAEAHSVEAAYAAVCVELGPPRALVASAGIDRGGLVHELALADLDAVLAVNLRGTFLTCRAALKAMLDAGAGGAIVCVGSPLGAVAAPGGTSAYSASKAGIAALVRTLAVDYGAHGIRVNGVLPGPTETELMWANVPAAEVEATRAIVHDEVPLGRLADPEEPARAALWLLSDAASYVTGSNLACDGGVLAKASISV
jgi:NAD(P)-dependent dehydrogenase (short-subunit alcohol dehydrogenase family)